MKTVIVFGVTTLALMLLVGCTTYPIYSREGYEIKNEDKLPQTCAIPIKYQYAGTEKSVLGKIESHEPVFGAHCHEEMVLTRFRQEACYLGANLVNIVEEKQPDYFWRACYIGKAELLKVKGNLKTDAKYEQSPLHERSMISHERAKAANAMAVGAGLGGGLVGGTAALSANAASNAAEDAKTSAVTPTDSEKK